MISIASTSSGVGLQRPGSRLPAVVTLALAVLVVTLTALVLGPSVFG